MKWLMNRPFALINILFVFFISSIFVYQLIRPIDVLEDWHIELTPVKEYRVVDTRRLAVYHPNETLIFNSSSKKVSYASGHISRTLVCEPTVDLDEREILLDIIPATKGVGASPERASSIVLPDVVQFNRLPRICRLVIDITYTNVALWRNHSEHAETEPFIVEESLLTPREVREEIERLNTLINDLEARLMGAPTTAQPAGETIIVPEGETYLPDTPPVEPPQEAQQRGIIESTLNRADGILNGLLRR